MTTANPFPDDPARELRSLLAAGRFQEAFDRFREGDSALVHEPEGALLAATAATRLGRYTEGVTLAEEALAQFRARGDRDGRMRVDQPPRCDRLGARPAEGSGGAWVTHWSWPVSWTTA